MNASAGGQKTAMIDDRKIINGRLTLTRFRFMVICFPESLARDQRVVKTFVEETRPIYASAFSTLLRRRRVGGLCRPRYMI
jgi:hypothetical protein